MEFGSCDSGEDVERSSLCLVEISYIFLAQDDVFFEMYHLTGVYMASTSRVNFLVCLTAVFGRSRQTGNNTDKIDWRCCLCKYRGSNCLCTLHKFLWVLVTVSGQRCTQFPYARVIFHSCITIYLHFVEKLEETLLGPPMSQFPFLLVQWPSTNTLMAGEWHRPSNEVLKNS